MKPRVLVDCDGVLSDFVGAASEIMAKATSRIFHKDEIVTYRVFDILTEPYAIRCRKMLNEPGVAFKMKPLPGSQEFIRELGMIADVYVVTAQNHESASWAYERAEWLRIKYGIGHERIVFTHSKHVVYGNVFIDDNVENLESWKNHHINGVPILFSAKYNQAHPEFWRTDNYEHIIDAIKFF